MRSRPRSFTAITTSQPPVALPARSACYARAWAGHSPTSTTCMPLRRSCGPRCRGPVLRASYRASTVPRHTYHQNSRHARQKPPRLPGLALSTSPKTPTTSLVPLDSVPRASSRPGRRSATPSTSRTSPAPTAPAQVVIVTEQLSPDLNLNTFQLGDFGFGTTLVQVPAGLMSYSTQLTFPSTAPAPHRTGSLSRLRDFESRNRPCHLDIHQPRPGDDGYPHRSVRGLPAPRRG